MAKKVLVLGVNGFIGSSLSPTILAQKEWEIYGMDLDCHKLEDCINHERFHFTEGDILIQKEWVEYHVKKCDVVLPLVAIATPATYVQDPIRVFELDFEANLEIIRHCVKYNTRVIFPSTSEVYGMSEDTPFDEQQSRLVLGPINKQRWIYSCSKQLMDRIIYAYGEKQGLPYSLFRPFNWIGPQQDDIFNSKQGSSRVLTQFIGNVLRGDDISLVNGGEQRRCFTYIDDGIDALIKIIENENNCSDSEIFNIGNPDNNHSIRELAETLLRVMTDYPELAEKAQACNIVDKNSDDYYGRGYEDVQDRVPSIKHTSRVLHWQPQYSLEQSLQLTLDYHLSKRID